MKQNRITLYGCFILLLAACSQVGTQAQPDEILALPTSSSTVAVSPTDSETTPPTQELDMTQTSPPPGMEGLIESAKEDLAQRLSISVTEIDLTEAKAVTWPDASLGCPQPGVAFAQVLTPGYLVILEVNEKSYEYHTDMLDDVILCDSVYLEDSPSKNTDGNVQDGWPNQTKNRDVIIITPTPQK